jgi:hypothetical protein
LYQTPRNGMREVGWWSVHQCYKSQQKPHIFPPNGSLASEAILYVSPKVRHEEKYSKVHDRLHVSPATSVDAHGVAIVNSRLDDKFQYRRAGKFSIYVRSNTEEYEITNKVSFINLRTFKSGAIAAGQVCWFSRIRGSNRELWTPGGDVRRQKLYGSKKFAFRWLVVGQTLDGRSLTVHIQQIPIKDTIMEDVYEITASDRGSSFMKRYQCLMPESFPGICPTQYHQRERLEPSTGDGSVLSTAFPSPLLSANPRPQDVMTPVYILDYFGNMMDSISGNYAREKADPIGRGSNPSARSARTVHQGNRKCSYSTLHTDRHYRSPTEKFLDNHEHCVSQLLTLPADARDCIWGLKLYRHHQRCGWRSESCTSWPPSTRSKFDTRS